MKIILLAFILLCFYSVYANSQSVTPSPGTGDIRSIPDFKPYDFTVVLNWPNPADATKFLRGDRSWATISAGLAFPLQASDGINSFGTCPSPNYSFTSATNAGMGWMSGSSGPGANPGLGFCVQGQMQAGIFGGDFWATSIRGLSGTSASTLDLQGVWEFDTSGNQFLITDNTYNFGKITSRAKYVFVGRALATGVTGNTDSSGTVSTSASTSGSTTFPSGFTYTTAPRCTLTPTADTTTCGAWWVTSSTTAVTVNVHTACSVTFNYDCWVLNL